MWLQVSELTAKVGSMPAAYPADSTKAFCEVCNNAVIAKHCELKRHNWQQKHSDKTEELFACSLMQHKVAKTRLRKL